VPSLLFTSLPPLSFACAPGAPTDTRDTRKRSTLACNCQRGTNCLLGALSRTERERGRERARARARERDKDTDTDTATDKQVRVKTQVRRRQTQTDTRTETHAQARERARARERERECEKVYQERCSIKSNVCRNEDSVAGGPEQRAPDVFCFNKNVHTGLASFSSTSRPHPVNPTRRAFGTGVPCKRSRGGEGESEERRGKPGRRGVVREGGREVVMI